jgi:CsoR family transcriptional regulator, copper-sensing transcriptional repressor
MHETAYEGGIVAMDNMGSEADRKAFLARLKRVEGQLRAIRQLIEGEADCEDIAHQLFAARRALDKSFYSMIACAYRHQFGDKLASSARLRKGVEKMSSILARFS